jgi:RHS repeat-associated protein
VNGAFTFGNRLAETQGGTPTVAMPTSSSATYNVSNQLMTSSLSPSGTPQYDLAGDVSYDGMNDYIYDAEGRICAVQNSGGSLYGYIYDAAGIRVAKGTLTRFTCDFNSADTTTYNGFAANTSWVLGQSGEQIGEFAVSGTTNTWKHSNVYAAGKLLSTYDTVGLHFYFDDWLGTRRIQTNALGQLELTCRSLPYGNGENCIPTALATADDPTEQHFTGKERDTESGNDDFGARYYASSMGRFLSPDWSAQAEPVPYAKMDDPQTLNLYGYLRNNPLGGVDADGHCGSGPNDPPCSAVKVEAKVTQQPKIEKNTPVENSAGKVIAHGTGPTGGQLTDTVTVNNKPVEGVGVAEKNVIKDTENGKAIPGSLNENRSPVPTDSNGQIVDNISMQLPAAGSAQGNNAIVTDMSTNVYTSTDKQTLTLTFPSGSTCTATSTRVMTNAGPDGKPSATYTLRTTQPVVHDPSN